MPSPIVHIAGGYLVYQVTRRRTQVFQSALIKKIPFLLVYTIVISLLPDVDGVVGILAQNFGRFHNNGTHSLVVGIAIALLISGGIWLKQRSGFATWFTVTLLSYGSHVLLDFFTYGGRGVMLFWPFTSTRFESPIKLFYGVRWSEGLLSVEHLWTLATELLVVFLAVLLIHFVQWKRDEDRERGVVISDLE